MCIRDRDYTSKLKKKGFTFSSKYRISDQPVSKTNLDLWLTERYCLYLDRGSKTYIYEIHHLPWKLQKVALEEIQTNYLLGEINLNSKPDHIQYSPGVKVIAWKKAILPSDH